MKCEDITSSVQNADMAHAKFEDMRRLNPNTVILVGAAINNKAYIWLALPEKEQKDLSARDIIKKISQYVSPNNQGDGNNRFAIVVGEKVDGLAKALKAGEAEILGADFGI